MGQKANPRRVAENAAMAKARMIKTSPQKLNLVAQMIRGKKVEKALADLTFSRKRVAQDVKKVLMSAVANAEENHDLDVDALVVDQAFVGKNLVLKRWRPRGRGRVGRLMKPFAEITIVVKEVEEVA
ncbi:MAG: 50S ribosomal protein L22 [Pseudomonadota bacterium]